MERRGNLSLARRADVTTAKRDIEKLVLGESGHQIGPSHLNDRLPGTRKVRSRASGQERGRNEGAEALQSIGRESYSRAG